MTYDLSPQATDGPGIRVLVRVRPPAPHELQHDQAVEVKEDCKIRVYRNNDDNGNASVLESKYKAVIPESSSQADVFELVKESVVGACEGYNTTIFAYGQTGTGKTYTMMGAPEQSSMECPDQRSGIIPRAVRHIFTTLRNRKSIYKVSCSFVEIYSDRLHDLLQPYKQAYFRDPNDMVQKKAGLEIREDGKGELIIPDLKKVIVTSAGTVEKLVEQGNKNRAVRHTELNQHSSRSHTILQMFIEQKSHGSGSRPDSSKVVRSKINFVDLAGSERWNTSHDLTDERVNEMTSINSSLSSLGWVVSALTERNRHIPYRSSKLTHLLQDSLGGNCKTTMLFTVSPSSLAFEETCSTLRFADRARNIVNNPVINVQEDLTGLLEKKDKEIQRLRQIVASLMCKDGAPMNALEEHENAEDGEKEQLQFEIDQLKQALQNERDSRAKVETMLKNGEFATGRPRSASRRQSPQKEGSITVSRVNRESSASTSGEKTSTALAGTRGNATPSTAANSRPPSGKEANGEGDRGAQPRSRSNSQKSCSGSGRTRSTPDFSMYAGGLKTQKSRRSARKPSTAGSIKCGEESTPVPSEKGSIASCATQLNSKCTSSSAVGNLPLRSLNHGTEEQPKRRNHAADEVSSSTNAWAAARPAMAQRHRFSDPGTSTSIKRVEGWGRSSVLAMDDAAACSTVSSLSSPDKDCRIHRNTRRLVGKASKAGGPSTLQIPQKMDSSIFASTQKAVSRTTQRKVSDYYENFNEWGGWGRSSLMAYSEDRCDTEDEPATERHMNSEILRVSPSKSRSPCKKVGESAQRRKSPMRTSSTGLDAGSLIYILGNSSNSLKAKMLADLLNSNEIGPGQLQELSDLL